MSLLVSNRTAAASLGVQAERLARLRTAQEERAQWRKEAVARTSWGVFLWLRAFLRRGRLSA